ncbi:MAG: gamma carbonic anhydrase family protein [Oscillospiraceae bacterium]|nr:gamma carbonic anhydrase family protein [Oscillospiraceae bacterium]
MNHIVKNGTVYIAPNATVVGDVVLENNANIWYGAVLRGDCGQIHIGENTNIQDNCVLHDPVTIGKGCTIGHAALVHGCTIGDHTMIGMGAIVLGGAQIGNHCIVAAGAVVKENMVVPDGHVVMGVPARIVGEVRQELIDDIYKNEKEYLHLSEKAFG